MLQTYLSTRDFKNLVIDLATCFISNEVDPHQVNLCKNIPKTVSDVHTADQSFCKLTIIIKAYPSSEVKLSIIGKFFLNIISAEIQYSENDENFLLDERYLHYIMKFNKEDLTIFKLSLNLLIQGNVEEYNNHLPESLKHLKVKEEMINLVCRMLNKRDPDNENFLNKNRFSALASLLP